MDLTDLARAYAAEGPFVTVYLATESDVPDAAERVATRWKNVVRTLEERDVDRATIEALEGALGTHDLGGTRVLVGARGRVVLATSLPQALPVEEVTVDALPALLPVVEHVTLQVPHLVVLADRAGADVLGYTGSGDSPDHSWTIDGDAPDIVKVPSGGWSQRRYQSRVEEGWEHNAKEMAASIDTAASDIDPQVIVAAGDDRELGLIRDHLPKRLEPLWQQVPGGRSKDGSSSHVAAHVIGALGDWVGSRTEVLLDRFAEERGRHDRATDGPASTLAALRRAQVETLLLTDGVDASARAFFGSDPTVAGLTVEDVSGLGETAPREAPLVDVLLRVALNTASGVWLLPAGTDRSPADGVGALLRYTT